MLTTAVLLPLAALAVDAPAKPDPPKVELLSVTKDGSLIIQVSNPNAEPLPYLGYLSSSFEGGLKEGAIAPIVMIRRGRYKFVHSPADPDQLYDNAADPDERVNLALQSDRAAVVADFRAEVGRRGQYFIM